MAKYTDLLLTGGTILTMDPSDRVYHPGSIAIGEGKILDIGSSQVIDGRWKAKKVIKTSGKLLMPGFINAHTHVAMAFVRGLGRLPSLNPLYDVAWPLESLLEASDVYPLARLGIAECLKGGTTTICDHYFFMDEIARACRDTGIRAVLGSTIMDLEGPLPHQSTWAEALGFIERWQGRTSRITPALAPHATDTVSSETLKLASRMALDEGLLLHLHLAQSRREVETIRQRHGKTPTTYLDALGALGPNTLAAHAIHLGQGDLETLVRSGCYVAYCPSSHASTGRIAPAAEMVKRGIPVALGTDCAAFNDDMDMFEEVRMALFSQNILEGVPWAIPVNRALHMATSVGARATGLQGITGSLEPEKKADILILNAETPRMTPLYPSTASAVVTLSASEAQVETVLVDGIPLVRQGLLTVMDEAEVVKEAREIAGRLVERARKRAPALYSALSWKP